VYLGSNSVVPDARAAWAQGARALLATEQARAQASSTPRQADLSCGGGSLGAQLCARTRSSLSVSPATYGGCTVMAVCGAEPCRGTAQDRGRGQQRCQLLSARSVALRGRGDARTKTLSRSSCLQSFARSCRTLMLCAPDVSCKCRRCDAARKRLGAWHVRACGWGIQDHDECGSSVWLGAVGSERTSGSRCVYMRCCARLEA